MREIETVSIGSVEDFLQEMIPQLGFQRMPIYRGQNSEKDSILPTLFREEVNKTEFKTWNELESSLLIRIKQRARGELGYEPMSELEWLSVAQHHGLPTRLSSWTENALVALFFATESGSEDEDGIVWRILPGDANLVIAQDYEQVPEQPRIYFPQKTTPAMLNQKTCYLCHPLPAEDAVPETFEEYYELGDERMHLAKLVVTSSEKAFIRRRLATMGIEARTLFLGMEGLCEQIREEIYSFTDSYEWVFPV
jgi:hypothetical protein